MSLCDLADAAGLAGEGFHKWRVPGTPTALGDFSATLLAAWLISWLGGVSLSLSTVFLLVAGMLAHAVFCVKLG